LWDPDSFTVKALVRAARGAFTQEEFAEQLGGVSQSVVSKYESGSLDPPSRVIETCVRIVMKRQRAFPSSDQVAAKVKASLADPRLSEVAAAIGVIVDAITPAKVGRPSRAK
jgi:predicted transcriptional regulator